MIYKTVIKYSNSLIIIIIIIIIIITIITIITNTQKKLFAGKCSRKKIVCTDNNTEKNCLS